jgi:ABC-2 type transport system ATP-binding protein
MTQGPPAIEVRDLCKSFRMRTTKAEKPRRLRLRAKGYRFQRVNVLDEVSFDVRRGELFGILGRNGSGNGKMARRQQCCGSSSRRDQGSRHGH